MSIDPQVQEILNKMAELNLPPMQTLSVEAGRQQFGTELFYSLQLTEHLNISPDIQLTFNPSFNPDKDIVGIFSVLRVRYSI